MAVELATAYVSLVPSASGIAAGIAAEMGGPLDQAASDAGDKSSKSFGAKFASGLKLAAAGAAAILTAGLAGVTGLEAIGSSFDDAGDKIRITTGKTGKDLDALQGSFKDVVSSVPADFDDASTAIATLNQKLGLTGDPLESLSTQVLNLSRITGTDLTTNVGAAAGVFNSWGTSVEEQGPKLDELFRISQATGISVSDLATQMTDGGVQFRQAGLSFEQSGSLLGILAKNGLSASDVLPALSKSMAEAAKNGDDASTAFQSTFDAIKNAPDDTSAAGIALDLFGAKAGPKFAALIREGKLSYEDLAATISVGGDTINEAATDTDDWREKLKLLANKALVYLEPIATKVFNAIGTAIEWATPFVRDIADWLGVHLPIAIAVVKGWIVDHLVPAFMTVVDWVVDHWPQIKAIAVGVFDAIRNAISYFIDKIVPKVVDGFKSTFGFLMEHKEILIGVAAAIAVGLTAMFVSWAAGAASAAAATIAATAPIIAIGVAIAAVVAGVIYAYNHFQVFHDVVDAIGRFFRDTLWPILQDVFGWLVDNVPGIIQGIIDVATWLWQNVLAPLGSFLIDAFQAAWATISTAIDIGTTAVGAVTTAAQWLWDNVLSPLASFLTSAFSAAWAVTKVGFDLAKTAVDGVVTAATWLWNNVLVPFGSFLSAAFATTWAAAKLAFQLAADAVNGISSGVGWLWNNILVPIGNFFSGAFATTWAAVKLAFDLVATAVGGITTAATWLWDNVLSPLVDWIGAGFQTGMAVAVTIFDGIKAAVQGVINFVDSLVGTIEGAIDTMRDLLVLVGLADEDKGPSGIGGVFNGKGIPPKGGKTPTNAAGTAAWGGGETWVNELGGEILDLPGGTRIWPHDISMQMADTFSRNLAAQGGAGGDVQVDVYIGDQKLTDMMDVRIRSSNRELAGAIAAGQR